MHRGKPAENDHLHLRGRCRDGGSDPGRRRVLRSSSSGASIAGAGNTLAGERYLRYVAKHLGVSQSRASVIGKP